MTDEPAHVEAVARYAMAKTEAENLAAYVERGRKLKDRSKEELDELYVGALRLWIDEPDNPRWQLLHNYASAEFEIRQIEPPIDRAKPYIDALAQLARRVLGDMTQDQLEDMNDTMFDEFADMAKRRN